MTYARRTTGRRRSGFTLIEVILYVAISAFMVVAILSILTTIVSTRQKASVGSIVQQNLRFAMDRITVTAHSAIGVESGASTFESDSGVIVFTMSGGVTVSPTIYSRCNNHICEKVGNRPAFPITGSGMIVDQLRITNRTITGTPATLKFLLHGQESTTGATLSNRASFTLQTTVSLRQ